MVDWWRGKIFQEKLVKRFEPSSNPDFSFWLPAKFLLYTFLSCNHDEIYQSLDENEKLKNHWWDKEENVKSTFLQNHSSKAQAVFFSFGRTSANLPFSRSRRWCSRGWGERWRPSWKNLRRQHCLLRGCPCSSFLQTHRHCCCEGLVVGGRGCPWGCWRSSGRQSPLCLGLESDRPPTFE